VGEVDIIKYIYILLYIVLLKIRDWLFDRQAKGLLLLVLIDLVATMIWYSFFQIEEANPLLVGSIESSLLNFTLTKLLLSLPGIWILNKYKDKLISKFGLALLSSVYFIIYLIHLYIMVSLISYSL
tara:strand:- start:223 stop:600 length:378 start_codon:yes stop_codon:yes gene_type:complete